MCFSVVRCRHRTEKQAAMRAPFLVSSSQTDWEPFWNFLLQDVIEKYVNTCCDRCLISATSLLFLFDCAIDVANGDLVHAYHLPYRAKSSNNFNHMKPKHFAKGKWMLGWAIRSQWRISPCLRIQMLLFQHWMLHGSADVILGEVPYKTNLYHLVFCPVQTHKAMNMLLGSALFQSKDGVPSIEDIYRLTKPF